jgi:uncharacterized repeat protein (TIGR03803 family)
MIYRSRTTWLFCILCAVSLAACSQTTSRAPGEYVPTNSAFRNDPGAASSYRVIYPFNQGDGSNPEGALLNVNGTLYGTLSVSGAQTFGSVFSVVSKTGAEQVIHPFGGTDGAFPHGNVILVKGLLYTTAGTYGAGSGGTVISLSLNGQKERVLHSFVASKDGSVPQAGLIEVKGVLYGTTSGGGKSGSGTVFSVSLAGKERVLHSFSGHDGQEPVTNLLYEDGVLYGTTLYGGKNNLGTVFSMSTTGAHMRVLHSFGAGTDGSGPQGSLIIDKGTLYGTTNVGGTHMVGTVFAMSTTGNQERVLYSFAGGSDGAQPVVSLLLENGTLYGTTSGGGSHSAGTIFSMSSSGNQERVLHSFGGTGDGDFPDGSLIDVNGTLYGTCHTGGANGIGIVYSLKV